jgi:hypothetical protein
MLYELDVLEARRIADLAAEVRKVRDRLLEKVPEAELGEPQPARGEHNPVGDIVLDDVLAREPEFIALRDAIGALPRDIRDKVWAVAEIGRGRFAIRDADAAQAEASAMSNEAIAESLLGEPDLHDVLRKGLYQLGLATLPSDAP